MGIPFPWTTLRIRVCYTRNITLLNYGLFPNVELWRQINLVFLFWSSSRGTLGRIGCVWMLRCFSLATMASNEAVLSFSISIWKIGRWLKLCNNVIDNGHTLGLGYEWVRRLSSPRSVAPGLKIFLLVSVCGDTLSFSYARATQVVHLPAERQF